MMERREFLKTAGVAAGAIGMGAVAGFTAKGDSNQVLYAGASGSVPQSALAAAPARLTGSILWQFPWDDRETGFGLDPGGDELEVFGPSTITMSPAGPAILDRVQGRIAVCAPTGEIADSIALPEGQAIDDVIYSGDGWVMTNTTLENPGIVLAKESTIRDAVPLSRDAATQMAGLIDGTMGPSLICEAGQIPIKAEGFSASDDAFIATQKPTVRQFELAGGAVMSVQGDRVAGAALAINGVRVHLPFVQQIKEVRPIGADPATGDVLVLILEVAAVDDVVVVQPWLTACDANGKFRWAARYPVEQALYIPRTPMTIDEQGRVLALVPRKEAVQVRVLDKQSTIETVPWWTIHGVVAPIAAARRETNAAQAACVASGTMAYIAGVYLNCYKYHNWTDDIAETGCTGRSRPDYMTGSGSYWSVPYKWGGFDTAAIYKDHIQDNDARAGDDTKGDTLACAAGVDCSGFVSRCWQKTSKYSTRTLPNISYHLSTYPVKGDIYNKYNDHVVMVDYVADTSGVKVWHATTGTKDRVVHEFVSWSYLSGYDPRRFDNKC